MRTQRAFVYIAAATLSLMSLAGQKANAGQLHDDWNYGIDSFTDGSGGSVFNIKGMAVKQSGNKVYVALTGGMPLGGTTDSNDYWHPGNSVHIGWGDLFFNFSGQDFQTASNNGQLFAVKFADYGSGLSTGVYQGVTAKSTTTEHGGYSNLKWYYDWGWGANNTQGTDLATAQDVYNYYYPTTVAQNPTWNNTPILNAIGSGTKVGNISMVSASQLSAVGLDFGYFSATGDYTIGFAFDKGLIASGNYVSNIFLECGNDGNALKGNFKSTPEPETGAGLFVFGLGFGMIKMRQRRKSLLTQVAND